MLACKVQAMSRLGLSSDSYRWIANEKILQDFIQTAALLTVNVDHGLLTCHVQFARPRQVLQLLRQGVWLIKELPSDLGHSVVRSQWVLEVCANSVGPVANYGAHLRQAGRILPQQSPRRLRVLCPVESELSGDITVVVEITHIEATSVG